MTSDSRNPTTEQAAPTGRDVYEENGWGGCEGASWDRLSPATQDGWEFAARVLAHQAPATEDGPTLPALLREYGDAIRGDWSDIDGRSVRDDLDTFASWSASGALPATARQTLGICPTGGGHWEQHCEPECDPPVTPEPSGFEGTRSALGALTIRKDQTDD